MKSPRAAFIHSDEIERYRYPEQCPFKTQRAMRTKAILQSMGNYTGDGRLEYAPRPATEEELRYFHTDAYLRTLQRVSLGMFSSDDLFSGLGTADTPVFPDLYPYAVLAAGGSLTAADLILRDEIAIAFNPSGGFHHAYADKAGGFCYINDVVLTCQHLVNAGKKVLCLDLDAHHGNGTQQAFYKSNRVFTISLHESGKNLFPWGGFEHETGENEGVGYNCNMPFPAGTDDDIYLKAFDALVPPLIEAYTPDVIVLEIGMDILSVDPLTHLKMTNNAIADCIERILKFEKPILAVGGGGYSAEDTARGWALSWTLLCNITMEEDLYMGLGGVFLGSSEWHAGLRDKHIYQQGTEKAAIEQEVRASIETLQKMIFPVHKI